MSVSESQKFQERMSKRFLEFSREALKEANAAGLDPQDGCFAVSYGLVEAALAPMFAYLKTVSNASDKDARQFAVVSVVTAAATIFDIPIDVKDLTKGKTQ